MVLLGIVVMLVAIFALHETVTRDLSRIVAQASRKSS